MMGSKIDCVWYVSAFRRPWEAAVIDSLAAALKAKKGELKTPQVYVAGGTANFRIDGILSWNSLTFFERAAAVLFKGSLWHLWGDPPFWWGWIRLRARTVHTVLDNSPKWRGHPTRFFAEQARQGESLIAPTFDAKIDWTDGKSKGDDEEGKVEKKPSTLLLAAPLDKNLAEALDSGIDGIPVRTSEVGASETETSLKRGHALFTDDSPSNVLLAAYLTMRGVPVVGCDAPLLQAVLGAGGYVAVPRGGDRSSWTKALGDVMSEAGRSASAGARHFLKKNYAASDAVESLEKLYRSATSRGAAKGKS
ncbi:MAG: hypothetical protein LBS00_12425 [Synergistaceae bacterium]|jgi:hypothetical protein|nr:hypothetical protein [Synergistaceae bacterium]